MSSKSGLDIMGIPTLFQSIANERQTGTLKIQYKEEEKYVYFRKGKIVQVSSPHKPSILAEGLRRHPDLEEDSYQAVCDEQRNTGKSLASILLAEENGAELVEAICQFQILEEVCELVTWEDCHSEFNAGDPDPMLFDLEIMDIEPVESSMLLLEGARRSDEWKLILETVSSKKDVPYLTEKEATDLNEEEETVWSMIDGFRDIEDILGMVRLSSFSAMTALAELVKKKLVALKSGRELIEMAKLDVFREDFHKRMRLYERAIDLGETTREVNLWLAHSYEAMGMRDKAAQQYRELGYTCLKSDFYPASIHAFEKATQLNPEDIEAQERLVALLLRTNRLSEYATKSTNFARWLSLQGDTQRAILLLREATQKYPKNFTNLDLLGALYQECGYRFEAVNVYRELAQLQVAREDFEGASNSYQKIILLDTENMDMRRAHAEILEKMGRTKEAFENYRTIGKTVFSHGPAENEKMADHLIFVSKKIIDNSSSDLTARKWLAEAYIAKNETQKATEQFKEILQRIDEKKNLSLLVDTLKSLVKLHPKDLENRFKLGETYLKMKREREAVQEYFAGGVAAAEMGNMQRALEAFARLLSFDPANYATRLKKSELLIEKGKQEEAIEELVLTGYLSIGSDKLWQAVKAFRQALTLDKSKVQCYLQLGKLYEKLGKNKEAFAAYKKHVQKSVKANNFGEALESCNAILELEPEHKWASSAKQKVVATLPKIQEAFQR